MGMMLKEIRARVLNNNLNSSSSHTEHITKGEKRPWILIGDASTDLFTQLEQLYWVGIEEELESALCALRNFQTPANQNVSLEDESDDFIHGFDTFIDQVSDQNQAFAEKVAEWKNRLHCSSKNSECGHASRLKQRNEHIATLELGLHNAAIEQESSQVKAAIRHDIQAQQQHPALEWRARSLLQAVGLLDMEKLIEYRPPLDFFSFWKRPAVPQLKLKGYSTAGYPVLIPQTCAVCKNIIKGSMYTKATSPRRVHYEEKHICEECYREKFSQDSTLSKAYKHCILDGIMSNTRARNMCGCEGVPRCDEQGEALSLFPIQSDHNHKSPKPGTVGCALLKLSDIVVEAKYDSIRSAASRSKANNETPRGGVQPDGDDKRRKRPKRRPRTVTQSSQQPAGRDPKEGSTVVVEEAEAQDDIPFFLRKHTEKYPFGNVHMSLRIGPVVIENGVEHTQGGAFIALRESPVLYSRKLSANNQRCLAVSEGETRQLWWQDRPHSSKPKRYKAIMKQVVGLPFTGFLDQALETSIVQDLIHGSKQPFDDPGLSRQDRAQWVKKLLNPCLEGIKKLIGTQVSIYLSSVVARMLHSDTKLRWSPTSNNCQNFCDALIDHTTFSPLVNPELYLLSFVCRPTAYSRPSIKSKFDVPQGLTEEYLLRFRFGRHDEADMIDTLQEYWYDWGAFGKHLYRYQDLFPWDCTEAFGRYPQRCGECNLAKHVWAFPFDSWSIIALHLVRNRNQYQPPDEDPFSLDNRTWTRNRLLVLAAQEKLIRGATAMVRNTLFTRRTAWLHRQPDATIDRVKLGGIHRAQPFSHVYDQRHGRYQHYFIASWALLPLEERVAEYEELRDGLMRLPDVEYARKLYEGEDLHSILKQAGGGADGIGGAFNDAMMTDSGLGEFGGAMDAGCASNCGSGCGNSACVADGSGAACGAGGGDGDGGGGGGCGGGCGGCG